MSNALAIAAVTATVSSLLQNVNQGTGLSGVSITTKPLDKARDSGGAVSTECAPPRHAA